MVLRRTLTLLVLFISALTASATTFIVPKDEDLVRSARYVVRGVISEKRVFEAEDGSIRTHYAMEIKRSLKGNLTTGSTLMFEEYGGMLPHRGAIIVSTPEYEVGEEALVMLLARGGNLRTHEMALGKFSIVGDRYIRGVDDESIVGFDAAMQPHVELARSIEGFERFIEDVVAGRPFLYDYLRHERSRDGRIQPTVAPNALSYTDSSRRRPEFDGGGSVVYRTNGNQTSLDGTGAADRAMSAWSDDSQSNVNVSVTGTTPASFFVSDGINAIELGMTDGFELCGAASAGCAVMYTLGQHTVSSITFTTIVEADIWIKNGVTGNQNVLDAIVTHEVGHTIGFRHSNDSPPATTNAIMNAVVGALGAVLQGWDTDAVRAVYGEAGPCTEPGITTQPQSDTIAGGQSTTLSVVATGTTPLTYQWFRATSPSATNPVGTNSPNLNTGVLNANTNFWVRVTNSCGTANSDTATITVTCDPVAITGQPQSDTISSGQSTSLSVTATGSSPSYQWFRGPSGTTTSPVGSNSPNLNTGALTTTTSFWVRVTNACGPPADSDTAVITVLCQAPEVASGGQPQGNSIIAGQSTTMSVFTNGTAPFTYQWFRGASGDQSDPIPGATQNSLNTGALHASQSFWVKVSNGCGSTNSQTAVINVTACDAIVISAQPQPQQITTGTSTTLSVQATGTAPLSFQWFRGASGATNSPVAGATSATLNTGNLSANASYWVRITNPCGTINSAAAAITVVASCTAPQITGTSPLAVTINEGAAAALSVTATGTSLAYQWFRGVAPDASNPIAGATGSALSTGALTTTSSFWVRVSNGCGTLSSNTFVVTVTPACNLTIISQPLTQTVPSGSTVILTSGVTAAGTVSFQWFRGASGDTSSPVVGATTSSLTLKQLRFTESYWMRVTSPCGTRNSDSATVTVELSKRKRPVRRG